MTHIYADILDKVQKPVRYIGNEWNTICKPWPSVAKHVALAFPDTYEIGMSHLGLRILYSLLNKREDMLAERVYCPWPDMEEQLEKSDLPLVTLESQTPIAQFEIVGFSLQYELEYTNVLTMLHLGKIPLYSRERTLDNPLIVAGGPCVFSPEPIADFIDCFVVGDGEEAFPNLIDSYCELRHQGLTRREVLVKLAQLPGIYVPDLYEIETDPMTSFSVPHNNEEAPLPVRRTYVEDLGKYPYPSDILVPNTDIVHERISIEIARGCTEGCRFCQAGTIYRPVRERKPKEIVDTILKSMEETGLDGASLTSLSTADYSCISPLVKKLMEQLEQKKASMSVSSMRVYGLTDTLTDEIGKVRRTGFTMAPEAGSERMRQVINKGISEEEILDGARMAFSKGWDHIKMYFMIGLPTETEEDLRAIVDLGVRILEIGKEVGNKVNVTISVSSFIPKPQSPFQWLGLEDVESLRQKQQFLLNLVKRHRRIRLKVHDVRVTWLEAIFSRGDRRLGKALEKAWREKQCRFDAWGEHLKYDEWREVFADLGLEDAIDKWLGEIPLYATLTWDHIDSLVEKKFQVRELKRALAGKFSPACEKPFKRYGEDRTDHADPEKDTGRPYVCYACGLECDLEAIRKERHESWNEIVGSEFSTFAAPPEILPTSYRASYHKLGEFRYLSALDLTRTLGKAFNRAKIALKYSEGYRPSANISYGPALPLGMESREEWLDFETVAQYPEDLLLEKLNENLPADLRFTSITRIPRKAPALFQAIAVAEYLVEVQESVPREVLDELAGAAESKARQHRHLVEQLLAQQSIMATVKKKRNTEKTIDIRPLILDIQVVNSTTPLSLRMWVRSGASGNLRPQVVLNQLYNIEPDNFRIVRARQYTEVDGQYESPAQVE